MQLEKNSKAELCALVRSLAAAGHSLSLTGLRVMLPISFFTLKKPSHLIRLSGHAVVSNLSGSA